MERPRPLLLEVIPSLLRKVETNWAQSDPEKYGSQEDRTFNRPLPAYIPGATFGELDLSEVTVRFGGTQKEEEQMGLAQALYEFCPGRVSKRYSTGDREPGYWLATSALLPTDQFEVSVSQAYPESLLLDSVNDEEAEIIVYQPIVIELTTQAQQVTERSNAFWQWQLASERLVKERDSTETVRNLGHCRQDGPSLPPSRPIEYRCFEVCSQMGFRSPNVAAERPNQVGDRYALRQG